MIRPVRLLLLLVPLALGIASAHVPGRAQPAPLTGRFALSDTTLLRDTLGLRFGRLFPLADSLGVTPDTLRALSVRYRMSLERMTFLSESLRASIDSVGVIMRREQSNPLANRSEDVNALSYTSAYNIGQTTSSWTNAAEWNLVRGVLFVHNTTDVVMDRTKAGSQFNLRQNRTSTSDVAWRYSPDASLGGRAILSGFDTRNPGSRNDEAENKYEFQLSARGRRKFSRELSSEMSFFSGLLDLQNTTIVKRGFSGDLNGKVRYQRGNWLVHDVNGRLSGNLARTRLPESPSALGTKDLSNSLDGTLAMYQSAPVSLNATYALRRTRVETPQDSTTIQQVRTDNDRVEAAVRIRRDNDRYVRITERLSRSGSASALNVSSQNTRADQSLNVQARYLLYGWMMDASFDNVYSDSRFPRRSVTGGYGDKTASRTVQAKVVRDLGTRFTLTTDGRVSLNVSRYYVIGQHPNPPVDRDQYRQSYRIDGQYNRSERMNTGLTLEVIRALFVNIASASTSANTEGRTYRSEWRWTYRLSPGLTAIQRNSLSADYVRYPFLPSNNRLSLGYKALTTVNAIVSPRTTLEITHDLQSSPSGNFTMLADGAEYFSKADESRNSSLRARIAFAPSSVFSLNVQTDYQSTGRFTVTPQGQLPQRDNRSLNLSAGGTLNVPLAANGRLSGNLNRTYRADRVTSYQAGVAQPSPLSERDYWNGRLELTWNP